jgi:hypothetical protein
MLIITELTAAGAWNASRSDRQISYDFVSHVVFMTAFTLQQIL